MLCSNIQIPMWECGWVAGVMVSDNASVVLSIMSLPVPTGIQGTDQPPPSTPSHGSGHGVEMHTSLGAHIPISIHLNLFALLRTATRTWPTWELSNAQLGTPNRVLRRSCMSSYSLSLPVSVAITQNSFRSVWTSLRYSAQPPAPNPHESSPMRSLVHVQLQIVATSPSCNWLQTEWGPSTTN